MVIGPRQAAYLEALGIDVYVRRDTPRRPAAPAADLFAPAVVPAPPPSNAGDGATLGWDALRERVAACTRCELHAARTQTVFGAGSHVARWMFIGEAPGAEEDRQGEPFVGRAGQLLTSMIRALGLAREDVYIANVLKCRPPGNRDPRPEEARACRGYLDRQIELVAPTLIVAVGRIAAQNLLGTDAALARLRGRLHALGDRRRPVLVTYHPAYLLRSPGEKRKAWQDLLLAKQAFGRLARGEQVLP
jgi:DNA polymerase